MKAILSLLVLSMVVIGCSSIPRDYSRSIPQQEISGISFKNSDGKPASYQVTKEGQHLYLEVGEYWSIITTQGIKISDNSTERDYIKTDDILTFFSSEYLKKKYQ